jgi:hypothetical protein
MSAGEADGVACDLGGNEGISVAVAADPGAELEDLGQGEWLDVKTVGGVKGLGDLTVEAGESFKDGDVVVVEAHFDFVVDGGPAGADFVGLPEAGDLGEHEFLKAGEILRGHGNAVERGEEVADAAALEHDGAARDFSGVGGEYGDDEDAAEPVEGLFDTDADAAHCGEGSGEGAALAAGFSAETQGDAAALAMVGLSEIDELEVEGEGAGEQDGALDGERVDQLERTGGVARSFFAVAAGLGVTAPDGSLAQRFDMGKEIIAGLFAQDFAEQSAQRAHIAAQGSFFEVAGLRLELGEALRPVVGIPQ